MKTENPIGFRLWPENRERLEYARRLGLNASQLVNEVLRDHLRQRLEAVRDGQVMKLKEVLAEPVP